MVDIGLLDLIETLVIVNRGSLSFLSISRLNVIIIVSFRLKNGHQSFFFFLSFFFVFFVCIESLDLVRTLVLVN